MSCEITMHVVVRGGGKSDVTYDMTLHAVVKGGGSYDAPWEMSMHVVVGKNGKFDVSDHACSRQKGTGDLMCLVK